MKPWTTAAVVVATVLFAVAVSNEIYNLTSPPSLSWHVLLRKSYSIGAFALVGYLLRRALQEWGAANVGARTIAGVAAYSAAIEVVQALLGSQEGLGWNATDIVCGAAGGALGVCDLLLRREAALTPPVRERPRR